jgi:cytochrome c556
MGWAMTPVRALLLSKAPYDAQKLEIAAVRTEELAGLIGPVFQADTRPFPVDTTALDTIWTDMADFDFKADALASAARALAMAAQAGDRIAVMQASSRVGMACGACHDAYRRKPTGSTR